MKTPCSDYIPTNGVIFFARMLDKLRLKDQGELPGDYNYAGCGVWDCFDARFCRFFGVDVPQVVERVSSGGTDEEILEWCFEKFGRPTEEKIEFWNNFITKRGWRDESSQELEEVKKTNGFQGRADVQTWVDFHDVDEGRTPRTSDSFNT